MNYFMNFIGDLIFCFDNSIPKTDTIIQKWIESYKDKKYYDRSYDRDHNYVLLINGEKKIGIILYSFFKVKN